MSLHARTTSFIVATEDWTPTVDYEGVQVGPVNDTVAVIALIIFGLMLILGIVMGILTWRADKRRVEQQRHRRWEWNEGD